MTKPWYQSRTVWANLVVATITFVVAVAQNVSGKTIPVEPAVQLVIVTVALAGINLILRRITGQPIT